MNFVVILFNENWQPLDELKKIKYWQRKTKLYAAMMRMELKPPQAIFHFSSPFKMPIPSNPKDSLHVVLFISRHTSSL